jgi:holdfast attachment protein HfaA
MRQIKTIAAFILLASLTATAAQAQAQNWNGASNYNGYGASTMNTSSNYSMRDANGNLTMVNGQLVGSNYSQTSGVQGGASGVGMQGATSTYAQATAIGNSLNVEVVGTHNTTIIDTTQVNNGDQTATNTLSH